MNLLRNQTPELLQRIYAQPLPTTPEGARAAARLMLSELPRESLPEAIEADDLACWTAIAVGKYLAGEAPD